MSNGLTATETLYAGKMTNCHSQSLLSAFFPECSLYDSYIFELYTTVPFGIMHITGDPYRLIDSFIDPDVGLDRALNTLGINYEVHSWASGTDASEAVALLREWLDGGPVVIGPLNMDGLPYLFHREMFCGVDHYVTALRATTDELWLSDPEGFVLAVVRIDEFIDAWRGDRIPEGRGEFIVRRILQAGKITCTVDHILATFKLGVTNLFESRNLPNGGSKGILLLAEQEESGRFTASTRRGLTFAIPTRIQRCYLIGIFVRTMLEIDVLKSHSKSLRGIAALIRTQMSLYAEVLSGIMNSTQKAAPHLREIAYLEDKVTDIFGDLRENI